MARIMFIRIPWQMFRLMNASKDLLFLIFFFLISDVSAFVP